MNYKSYLKTNWLISRIRHSWSKFKISKHYTKITDIDLSPIFVIGANRSGTSLITSLLTQHNELEGLFSGHLKPTFIDSTIHVIGYCESEHIWPWLRNPDVNFNNLKKTPDGMLWGHPKYISSAYKDTPKNKKEVLYMANAIAQYRRTKKYPLIKDQFNIFRIGLIKKAIPNAKFVLVVRNYDDYFKGCLHKWFIERKITEYRSIAPHWILSNIVAYCDLKQYAGNDHTIVNYNEIINNVTKRESAMNDICKKLGLNSYKFNFAGIKQNLRFSDTDITKNKCSFENLPIDKIIEEYSILLNTYLKS